MALGARWGPAPPRPSPQPLAAGGRRGCAGKAGGCQGRDGRGQRPAWLRGGGRGGGALRFARPGRPSPAVGGGAPGLAPRPGPSAALVPEAERGRAANRPLRGTHFTGWLWMGTGVAAESPLPSGSVLLVRRGCGLGVGGGSDVPWPGLNLFNVLCQGFLHQIERERYLIFMLLLTYFYFSALSKSRDVVLERV